MNKERRRKLNNIVAKLEDIRSELEDVKCDEEMAYDNMPENLQYSLRGEEMEEAIDTMDESLGEIDEALEHLNEAIGDLEDLV